MPTKRDGIIFGGLLGAAMTMPQLSTWIVNQIDTILPEAAKFAGSFSIPLYGIILGLIIGYIVDST